MTSAEAMAVDAASPSPAQNGRSSSSSSHYRLQPVAELVGHDGRCWGIDWSPEGDTLASCGADRTVRTWHQLRVKGGNRGGGGGRWAPDAVLEESQARAVRAVAWAPAPALLAASSGKGRGGRRQSELLLLRRRRRRRLAAASFDASVAVWEEERPAAAPRNDGDEINTGEIDDDEGGGGGSGGEGDDEPTLWSQVALLQGHESEVKGVAWSPLPGAIEAGSGSSEEEDEEEEAERRGGVGDGGDDGETPPFSSRPLPPLPADGEGCLLATCGRDRSVWLWESVPSISSSNSSSPPSGCEFECVDVKQGHSGDVKGLAWHPSGSVLASASYDGSVRLWVPEGGASEAGAGGAGGAGAGGGGGGGSGAVGDEWLCGQEVRGAHAAETVWSFSFEPRLRASRSEKKKTGGGRTERRSVAVRAASCGGDGRVSVWRCPLPSGVAGAAGEPAATESPRWEAGAVARSAAPPALWGRARPAYSVDWSPCGRWIACGGGDDFVRVFRAPPREEGGGEGAGAGEGEGGEDGKGAAPAAAAGEAVLELAAEARPLPPCEVNCVKWRRGRKRADPPMLAAACDDGVVRLWRLDEGGE